MKQNKKIYILTQIFFLSFTLILTSLILGYKNLNIFNVNWTLYNDAIADYLSWLYFKNDIWRFPVIGDNPNFGISGSSTLAFSGSIPFLAIIFKSLNFLITGNFTYFGIWIFICFYFQSIISFLLINKLTDDYYYSLVGSIFFCLSPILFNQIGIHFSLAGQWIIILSFYFYINENNEKKFLYNIFLIIFSTLVHFYFTIMLLTIYTIFAFCNLLEKKNFLFHTKKILILILALLPLMYVVGYFSIPPQDTLGVGYGYYKLNLLSPIDPSSINSNGSVFWSSIMPDIPSATTGELEGFSYFGLGQLLLILISLFLFLKKKIFNIKKILPYLLLGLIFLLLSLTHKIDVGKYSLIDLDINRYIFGILSLVRASGRFFWPIYYFLIFFSIYIISLNFNKRGKILILSLLLIIQIIDISNGLKNYIFAEAFNKKEYNTKHQIWNDLDQDYETVSSTYIKNQSIHFNNIIGFLKESVMPTEIAYIARFDRRKLIDARYNNYQNFYQNNLDISKFYIINNLGHANHLKFLLKDSEHAILKRDNIWLLLPNKAHLMSDKDIFALSSLKVKKIKLNEKLIFNEKINQVTSEVLGLGWSYDHSTNGIWSDGKRSSIMLDTQNLIKKSYNLEIGITPNLLKDNQKINLSISGDGIESKKLLFKKSDKVQTDKIKIKFKKKNLINRRFLIINFDIEGAVSAIDIRKSPDARKLGIKLNDLIVKDD
tara:strand:+ start:208 stop:2352 length:2145 start_codon:yes stop_codon:yes gene_type:complete